MQHVAQNQRAGDEQRKAAARHQAIRDADLAALSDAHAIELRRLSERKDACTRDAAEQQAAQHDEAVQSLQAELQTLRRLTEKQRVKHCAAAKASACALATMQAAHEKLAADNTRLEEGHAAQLCELSDAHAIELRRLT
eukprot:g3735.t1